MIGVGGMAAVYEATHRNGSKVAIKMLHPTLMFDTGFAHRLVQEGYVANKINHPAAVKIYDDDTDDVDGAVFLVMELLEGNTLSAVRRQRKRFGEAETLKMMIPVLECLGSAHQKGIIHRDIKPENLFVTKDNSVRVLDFGIARINDGSNMSQTRTGMVVGSPAYMSPEQALGKMNSVGPQTDVYAVGATMFAMLSGTTPHAGESTQEMIVLVATQSARSLKSVAPEVSDAVAAIIDRALSYEREARFPDAMAMLNEVRNALAQLEGAPAPKVLPTFADDEDDEGETRVAQPAVKAPGTGSQPSARPAVGAGPMGQRAPTPPAGTPSLAAKLRAPTMAPTGAPLAGAPSPFAPPPTQAMEAFPVPSAPGTSSGSFQAMAPRTQAMEAFPVSPDPGRPSLDPLQDTAPAGGLAGMSGPLSASNPEIGATSGQRAGVSTSMAWASASNPSIETAAVKPARPRWMIPAVAAAVVLLGVGVVVAMSGGGGDANAQRDSAAPIARPAARPPAPAIAANPPPQAPAVAQPEAVADAGVAAQPEAVADAGAAVAPIAAAVDAGAPVAANPPPAVEPPPQANARTARPPREVRPPRERRHRERPAQNANPLGY